MKVIDIRCFCFALLALACAAVAGPGEPPTDLERMQGNWRVLKIADGSDAPPPPEVVKEMCFSIKGDKMTPRRGLFLAQSPATLKLDPSKKPKTVDLLGFGQKRVDPPDGGQPKMVPNPEPVLGIYELDGDGLRFCLTGPGAAPNARPKEFKELDKRRQALLVLQRFK
jgi:uncharacterized protein (TIGR03067 family)